MNNLRYSPDWIPPPGATIEDLLSTRDQATSRQVIGEHLGERAAKDLFDGGLQIGPDLASFLAQSVGLSKRFWLERERQYREALGRREYEQEFLAELPVGEMKRRSYIDSVRSHAETVDEVVRYFGEDSAESCLEQINQLPTAILQKTSRTLVSSSGALAVWIRAGEREAVGTECSPWDPSGLRELLPEFRQLTRRKDPTKFLPVLKELCRTCGISFSVVRALSGCRARGAIKFLSPTKAMLLVSFRHLSDDQFWFSFFHEIAHLLLHPEDRIIVDDWDDSQTQKEIEADRFAEETLIPPDHQGQLAALQDDRSIIAFARRIGVSRGIIVGQMQHKGLVGFGMFNHLKVYYRWNHLEEIERKGAQVHGHQ